jgi:transposase InsO family protein
MVHETLNATASLPDPRPVQPGDHVAMQTIFFAWYNLCRPHLALDKKTPAMASGLTDKVWTVRELLERTAEA